MRIVVVARFEAGISKSRRMPSAWLPCCRCSVSRYYGVQAPLADEHSSHVPNAGVVRNMLGQLMDVSSLLHCGSHY